MEEHFIKSNNGGYWLCKDFVSSDLIQNFGLSHGLPSVIVILTQIYQSNVINSNKIKPLIISALSHLLSYKNNNEDSLFPTKFKEKERIIYDSRLAWCYGDLCIAIAFVAAGQVLNDKYLLKNGIDIATHTLKRLHNEKHGINDCGICHGFFGTAYIYQKFYYLTNSNDFLDAANLLYNLGLKFVTIEDRNEKILEEKISFYADQYVEANDLMTGYAGIGMCLLGRVSKEYTKWDSILLLFETK
jgi:lantibiotic biosynthesis protein